MAMSNSGNLVTPRPAARPAFRGQGSYGVFAGGRTTAPDPAGGLAGNTPACGVESSVKGGRRP